MIYAHTKHDHLPEQSVKYAWPFIKKLCFLQQLSQEEISLIRKLHEKTAVFDKHQEILGSKDTQAKCLIVNKGWACRYTYLSNGSRQVINYYLPGDIINLSALNMSKADYAIFSITSMHVSEYKPDTLQNLCTLHPKLESLCDLILDNEETLLVDQVVRIGRRSAYERTVHLLLELYHRLKAVGQTVDNTFSMPLTQGLLADTLGMSFVHMNRTLHKLRNDNLIDIQSGKIILLDFNKLAEIAEYQNALSKIKLAIVQNE